MVSFGQTYDVKNNLSDFLHSSPSEKETSKSILALEHEGDIELAGTYLEKAGKLKNRGVVVTAIAGGLGFMVMTAGDEPVIGSVIAGIGGLAGGVMSIAGNFLIKKAGKALRKEKIKL